MSIDYIKRKIYERELKKTRKLSAQDMHDARVKAIKEIAKTKGFKEIVEYWQREVIIHDARIDDNPKNVETVIEARRVAKNFLTFLENLLMSE